MTIKIIPVNIMMGKKILRTITSLELDGVICDLKSNDGAVNYRLVDSDGVVSESDTLTVDTTGWVDDNSVIVNRVLDALGLQASEKI